MSETPDKSILSNEVLNFINYAAQYTALCERVLRNDLSSERDMQLARLILSDLYASALRLPEYPTDPFAYLERFVTEESYHELQEAFKTLFGEDDIFLDTELHDMKYSDTPISVSLSEMMCDIYQVCADTVWVFRMGVTENMEHAVGEALYTFKDEWGVKVLTVLRQLHYVATDGMVAEVDPNFSDYEY